MALTEVYLTNSNVSNVKWLDFIHLISRYSGYLKTWKLIVMCKGNKIHYFIKNSHDLPTTINNMEDFLLKKVDEKNFLFSSYKKRRPIIHDLNDNFIDIYSYYESKKNKILDIAILSIFPISKNKFISHSKLYFSKGKTLECRNCYVIPSLFLSINFDMNKRFFYSKTPKYFKIEKQLNLLKNNSDSAILKIDTFPYLQGDFYLNQNSYQFNRHSLILGSSGSGKSKLISLLVNNINQNLEERFKYKIVIIDPHASLENDIGGINDSKVIDFDSDDDSISLFSQTSKDFVSQTELFLDLFKTLIAEQYNSKLERVLRYSIHFLLISENFNFVTMRKLLLDTLFRTKLLSEYKLKLPISVLEFFLNEFSEIKTSSYSEAISPIISFIDEMQLLPIFNDSDNNNKFTLEDTIKNNFLTIFSLDRIKLGDKITKTISGLIMQQLLGLVQSYTYSEHIIFILDEISVIENPIVCKFLSEARKYNVSLFMSGQYLNQVSNNVKDAIFANVINYYIFRISKLDANFIVDSFDMNIPLANTKEYKIKMLTELPNRTCIMRISNGITLYSAMKAITLDFLPVPRKRQKNTDKYEIKDKKIKKGFSFKTSVSLNDIMKETSTSRKELK